MAGNDDEKISKNEVKRDTRSLLDIIKDFIKLLKKSMGRIKNDRMKGYYQYLMKSFENHLSYFKAITTKKDGQGKNILEGLYTKDLDASLQKIKNLQMERSNKSINKNEIEDKIFKEADKAIQRIKTIFKDLKDLLNIQLNLKTISKKYDRAMLKEDIRALKDMNEKLSKDDNATITDKEIEETLEKSTRILKTIGNTIIYKKIQDRYLIDDKAAKNPILMLQNPPLSLEKQVESLQKRINESLDNLTQEKDDKKLIQDIDNLLINLDNKMQINADNMKIPKHLDSISTVPYIHRKSKPTLGK